MEALEAALASLELSDSVNYAQTAREYGVDPTTLRRRHKGKQVSRHQAAFESKSPSSTEKDPWPSTSNSLGSSILSQVDAPQLRCLFDQVIPRERRRNPKARKLEKTIESIQADCAILLYENKDSEKPSSLRKGKENLRVLLKTISLI
jgi:transposase-like protein